MLAELRPLVRRAGKPMAPHPGETARAWLGRLGTARPARVAALEALAEEVDAVAYGGKDRVALRRQAQEEALAWVPQGEPGQEDPPR